MYGFPTDFGALEFLFRTEYRDCMYPPRPQDIPLICPLIIDSFILGEITNSSQVPRSTHCHNRETYVIVGGYIFGCQHFYSATYTCMPVW
jgi:hypothetical protein